VLGNLIRLPKAVAYRFHKRLHKGLHIVLGNLIRLPKAVAYRFHKWLHKGLHIVLGNLIRFPVILFLIQHLRR